MLKAKLFWQMAITIVIMILSVESVFLYFSIDAKRAELLELRQELNADAIQTTGQSFAALHPDILTDEDIERRAQEYRRNIVLMVIVLTILVSAGALFVFYVIAMRPLANLIHLIRQSKAPYLLRFEGSRPSNEIGELIEAREIQLDRIAEYQNKLEDQMGELRREVIESEKFRMLGELSAGIIHDINNPLQLLIFHLDDLAGELKDPHPDYSKALESVESCKYATHKIRGLMQRMTGFVRKSQQSPGYFNIAEPVAETIDLLRTRLKQAGVDPKISVPDNLECFGYTQDLEQVLVNLVSNAIDALETSPTPRLDLTASMRGEGLLEIGVKDNGPGIPEHEQEEIFKSLYTTKPAGKGTGLGLSNVARIVADYQGKIELDSAPGQGAEFKLCLPGRITQSRLTQDSLIQDYRPR